MQDFYLRKFRLNTFHSFYRVSIAMPALSWESSFCLSVRLSHVCIVTKLCTADILIPHERAITLLL